MADGILKQINPFSGTEAWTVPGRAHRPFDEVAPESEASSCAFCWDRKLETPPEKTAGCECELLSFEPLFSLCHHHLLEMLIATVIV